MNNPFGIYEKALPKVSWQEKFALAQKLGFDFIELSIDESDDRLARLDWNSEKINEINSYQSQFAVRLRSICFSGQRRYPMGSHDSKTRATSLRLLAKCIHLAQKLNVPVIQLAGYDVYYEDKDATTKQHFLNNLNIGIQTANQVGVMLAFETMDDVFLKNISEFLAIKSVVASPWLGVYPDIGNLSAWVNGDASNVCAQLTQALPFMTGIHIKDTLAVTKDFLGKFKNVDFGSGCVDFVTIFKHLKHLNFNGSMMIEAWYEDLHDTQKTIAALKTNLAWVKDKLRQGGYLC